MKQHLRTRTVRHIAVAVLLASAAHTANAQQQKLNPVSWRARSPGAPVARGGVVPVTVLARIDTGWHVYSLTQPDGGPSALTFGVAPATAASIRGTVKGPKPRIESQKAFDVPTELYDAGTVSFTVPLLVKRDAAAGRQTIQLTATWQSCSKSICLPPRTQTIPVDITVTAP